MTTTNGLTPATPSTFTVSVTQPANAAGLFTFATPSGTTTSGTAASTPITVSYSSAAANLATPGTYNGSLTVTVGSTTNPTSVTIPLSLVINAAPTLTTVPSGPTGVVFNAVLGGTVPAAQTMTVTSASGQPVTFTVNPLSLPSWLTVAPLTGTAGTTSLTLTPSTAGLPVGTFAGQVTLTTGLTPATFNSSVNVPVSLVITAPTIMVSPIGPISFTGVALGAAPPPQVLTFSSNGAIPAIGVTGAPSWLTVVISGLTATLTANQAGLSPGTYAATLAFTGTPGANNPLLVGVTFNVMPPPSCTLTTTATGALTAAGTSTGGFTPNVPASVTVTPNNCSGTATVTSTPLQWLTAATSAAGFTYQALSNSNSTARTGSVTYTVGTGISTTGGGTLVFNVTVAADTETVPQREVRALYERMLGRDPDLAGDQFWNGVGAAGLGQMADSFLNSPESYNSDFAVMAAYQAATGAPPTYAQFVVAVTGIRTGTQTIAGLYNSLTAGGGAATVTSLNTLFTNLLNRTSNNTDQGLYLGQQLSTVFMTLTGLPSSTTIIVPNNEFQSTGTFHTTLAADHTNGLYVRMLYYTILQRDPDLGGLDFWLGIANSGGPGIMFQGQAGFPTRIQILGPGTPNQGFTGSPEFQDTFQ